MNIVPIFGKKIILCAIADGNSHAFFDLRENWRNTKITYNYFKNHQPELASYCKEVHWPSMTPFEAALKTRRDANDFLSVLYDMEYMRESEIFEKLTNLFKPLSLSEYTENVRKKAYNPFGKGWLRIYAIKIKDSFIVIGGAIKLTEKMYQGDQTQDILKKFDEVLDYLRQNHIFDKDTLGDFLSIDI